jgi:hypothetical protein
VEESTPTNFAPQRFLPLCRQAFQFLTLTWLEMTYKTASGWVGVLSSTNCTSRSSSHLQPILIKLSNPSDAYQSTTHFTPSR